MGGHTNGKVPPIFGPADADVLGALENIMTVTEGNEFDFVSIEEADC